MKGLVWDCVDVLLVMSLKARLALDRFTLHEENQKKERRKKKVVVTSKKKDHHK